MYKHSKVITRMTQSDGNTRIKIENYNEELMSITQRIEQRIISTESTLLADHIKALKVMTDGTTDCLELTIKRSPNGSIRIIKTWTVHKEM